MNEPIFIVGAPRSGTTLMAKILGRHPRIFMPGETHFFDDIYSRRKEFGDPPSSVSIENIIGRLRTIYSRYNEPGDQERIEDLLDDNVSQLLQQLRACNSYKEIFSLFMECQAKKVGKARWGNNTPRDLFYINEILSFYPDAKIIICVRDLRDFILSYKHKWRTTKGEHARRLKKIYHPLVTSLLWKASIQRIIVAREAIPKTNLSIFRYEDLVFYPERTIKEVCKMIGEEFRSEMLSINFNNSSVAENSSGIFTSSVGYWRSGLSGEETFISQYIAGRELEKIGYSREEVSANYSKVIYFMLTSPFALIRAIYANRDKRGPLFPYLVRRVSSFFTKSSKI
jgi:hypothetical protein